MLTTQEIYNFLINAAEVAPLPGPPPAENASPPPLSPMPIGPEAYDSRIENLRTRLQALIGTSVKHAATEEDKVQINRVFGKTPGEADPEAEPLDPEWEQLLRMVVGDGPLPDAFETVSLRPKRSMP